MPHMECRAHSALLQRMVTVHLYLPTRLMKGEDDVTTVTLLHDLHGGGSDWFLRTSVERYAEQYGFALVMPSIENSCGVNMPYGDPYADFLCLELPRLVASLFPLRTEKERQVIAGCGFGGFGAVHAGLLYPERFRAVISICGIMAGSFVQTGLVSRVPCAYATYAWGDTGDVYGTENDLYLLLERCRKENKQPPAMIHVIGTDEMQRESDERFLQQAADMGASIQTIRVNGGQTWESYDQGAADAFALLCEQEEAQA